MPNHYDVPTITVRPNTHPKALLVLKDQLANTTGLLAWWSSDIGVLNPIMVIRAIADVSANLNERRALLVSRNPFGIGDLIDEMAMDTYTALDCVARMAPGEIGPFYEVRTTCSGRTASRRPSSCGAMAAQTRKVSPILTAMMSQRVRSHASCTSGPTEASTSAPLTCQSRRRQSVAATGGT